MGSRTLVLTTNASEKDIITPGDSNG
jgi:hypothetical protein